MLNPNHGVSLISLVSSITLLTSYVDSLVEKLEQILVLIRGRCYHTHFYAGRSCESWLWFYKNVLTSRMILYTSSVRTRWKVF